MKKRQSFFLILAVMLTLGFIASEVQAGVKVDIVFKMPGYTYNGTNITTCDDGGPGYPSKCVNLGNVRIYLVSTNQSCWLTNGNRACTFEDVQSGYNPKLFRFEWQSDIGRPAQVVDAWIDIPNTKTWGLTYVYDVPAHNVVFTSDVGNRDIGMISQSIVADRRGQSIINKKYDDVILLKGNLRGGLTPVNVPMLDGCYTIYYFADNKCPGKDCVRYYLDYPLCVGGAPNAVNEVHLEDDQPAP